MAGRLEGKVAIVTGGASGMGLATVERFVAEGARVVFCDIAPGGEKDIAARLGDVAASVHHTEKEKGRQKGGEHDGWAIADRLGDNAYFIPADVSDVAELTAVVEGAVERYGRLDIMFNNAGICANEGSIVDCPEAIFDRTIAIDLKAVWVGIKLAARKLMASGGGSIISTASTAGLGGTAGIASYSAAKGGIIGLTRAAAMDLAPYKIRVNCICPGTIVTPIARATFGADFDLDLVRSHAAAAQPLPKVGEAADIAAAALFLASDDSSFVTGIALPVDGGTIAEANALQRNALMDQLTGND